VAAGFGLGLLPWTAAGLVFGDCENKVFEVIRPDREVTRRVCRLDLGSPQRSMFCCCDCKPWLTLSEIPQACWRSSALALGPSAIRIVETTARNGASQSNANASVPPSHRFGLFLRPPAESLRPLSQVSASVESRVDGKSGQITSIAGSKVKCGKNRRKPSRSCGERDSDAGPPY